MSTNNICLQKLIRKIPHKHLKIIFTVSDRLCHSNLKIQEGQLSVSGERMCTILVNRLED